MHQLDIVTMRTLAMRIGMLEGELARLQQQLAEAGEKNEALLNQLAERDERSEDHSNQEQP